MTLANSRVLRHLMAGIAITIFATGAAQSQTRQPRNQAQAQRPVERLTPPTAQPQALSPSQAPAVAPVQLSPADQEVATELQTLLVANLPGDTNGQTTTLVRRFYRERGLAPAWLNDAQIGDRARGVIAAIEGVGQYGMNPADYGLERLRALSQGQSAAERAQFDLAMTAAVLRLGTDQQGARLTGLNLPVEARTQARSVDPVATLLAVAQSDNPGEALQRLGPNSPEFRRLNEALAQYRDLVARGGWPTDIPDAGRTIEPGQTDPRIEFIRRRLAVTDGASLEGGAVYDAALQAAVRRFQRRHGFNEDARIGRLTIRSMNISAETRMRQIEVNLDRLRAMPPRSGGTEIYVNIPEFRLRVYEGDTVAMEMRVVAGRPERPTPILSSRIVEIIFNPTWTVPTKVAREDLLPRFRRNPQDMVDRGFRVFAGWSSRAQEIDVASYDWRSVTEAQMNRLMVRQDSGPRNALGQMRLTLTNTPDIYLHDTPDRGYFLRDMRGLSSGCIRLERPSDLVEYVMRHNRPQWDQTRIRDTIRDGDERRSVPVARPVPVHLIYVTSWVTPEGEMNFREDIYGIDQMIVRGLAQRPAPSTPAGRRNAAGDLAP